MSVQVGGGVRGRDGSDISDKSDISDGSDKVGRSDRVGRSDGAFLGRGVGYLAEKL